MTNVLVVGSGDFGLGSTTANFSMSDASNTVMIGGYAGVTGTAYDFSTLVGYRAGQSLLGSAGGTTAFGYQSLRDTTSGAENSAFGISALRDNTDGQGNTALGWAALAGNNSGDFNTAIGGDALAVHTAGFDNIGIGYQAADSLVAGTENILIGKQVADNTTSSNDSVIIGDSAFSAAGASESNVIIGSDALLGVASAYNEKNVIIGTQAGYSLANGAHNNILIGWQAGAILTSGSGNIVIGYDIDPISNTASNQLTIGNLIFGTGLDGTGTTISDGFIGIGTSTPANLLSVGATTSQQFLVNNNGIVLDGVWQGTAVVDAYVANTLTVNMAADSTIVNASDPTINAVGEIGVETASSTIRYHDGSTEFVLNPEFDKSYTMGTTTVDKSGNSFDDATTTHTLWNPSIGVTLTRLYGKTDTGTLAFRCGDGTNFTEFIIASATGQEDDGSIANGAFVTREDFTCEVGSAASSPLDITITATFKWTAN